MARFTTLSDAVEQAVIPSLEEYADTVDVVAVAREAFAYRVDRDEHGNELLNTAGYEQVVTRDEYWKIVSRHEL